MLVWDKVFGTVDGAVDVALGGKVQHGTRAVLIQQAVHQGAVAEVALHEDMTQVAVQSGEVFQVASVGEFVEVENWLFTLGQPVEHEVAANEFSASCY